LLCFLNFSAFAQTIVGVPQIIDGDSLLINRQEIRLQGVDAVEYHQDCQNVDNSSWNCGKIARSELEEHIASKEVNCESSQFDNYKRALAVCKINDESLNDWLVRSGWALAYRHYSKEYVSAELEAKYHKRGIWKGRFQKPWIWRRENPR